MSQNKYQYRFEFGWSTLLGILSFGILVPTFFIPSELGSTDHFISIVVATITAAIIWEGSKLIQSIIDYHYPWDFSIPMRLSYEILSIFIFSTAMLIIGIFIYNQIVSTLDITIGTVLRNMFVSFLLALLFTAINEGAFLFNNWKESLIEQEKLKKEALEAKVEGLKKQLDPHFLFNSLSVLSGVIHHDQELADVFITKLSQVYRYVIEHNSEKKVALKGELEFVESYFFLLDVRFKGAIKLNISDEVKKLKGFVLPLSLQLLVENAVKHNKLVPPLVLNIYIDNDKVWLENKLQKRGSYQEGTGIGLHNLENRYTLLTGKKIEIIKDQHTFKVGIPLLKE